MNMFAILKDFEKILNYNMGRYFSFYKETLNSCT